MAGFAGRALFNCLWLTVACARDRGSLCSGPLLFLPQLSEGNYVWVWKNVRGSVWYLHTITVGLQTLVHAAGTQTDISMQKICRAWMNKEDWYVNKFMCIITQNICIQGTYGYTLNCGSHPVWFNYLRKPLNVLYLWPKTD